jgi:hypothetical protein
VPLLLAVPADFGDGHAGDVQLGECVLFSSEGDVWVTRDGCRSSRWT